MFWVVQAFLEGLLESFLTEAAPPGGSAAREEAPAGPGTQARTNKVLLVSAAAVELLKAQPGLSEHAASLGYGDKLLRVLTSHLPSHPLSASPFLPFPSFPLLHAISFIPLYGLLLPGIFM